MENQDQFTGSCWSIVQASLQKISVVSGTVLVLLALKTVDDWDSGIGSKVSKTALKVLDEEEYDVFFKYCFADYTTEEIAWALSWKQEKVDAVIDSCANKISGKLFLPQKFIKILMNCRANFIGLRNNLKF